MTGTAKKKNSLTREQAQAMYEDLRKNFAAYSGGKPPSAVAAQAASSSAASHAQKLGSIRPNNGQASTYGRPSYQRPVNSELGSTPEEQILAMMLAKQAAQKGGRFGSKFAVSLVLLAAGFKLALGAIEYSGVLGVENAQANINYSSQSAGLQGNSNFSAEQVALLKALDGRRAELEERRKALDKREEEFTNRDREFAIKLAELRELTSTLKGNRESELKKKTTQLDQLSNVYGSMDPKEAAELVEQLDDTIALELLNRMPEKRIGQILSLMKRDKALVITKMLSGKLAA